MNHAEIKFEKKNKKGQSYLIFHLHISNSPYMYMYKKITSHKRGGAWAWSFQIVKFRLARGTVIQR